MIIYKNIDSTVKDDIRTSSLSKDLNTTIGKNEWVCYCIPSPIEEQKKKGWGFRALIEKAEEEGFIGTIPVLVGCITEGESLEETIGHLKDAMDGWLEVAKAKGLKIPDPNCQFYDL
jgi:antitoxin HicB